MGRAKYVIALLVLALPLTYVGYNHYRNAGDPMGVGLLRLPPESSAALSRLSASKVVMFGVDWCPYCAKARTLFKRLGVNYVELDLDHDPRAKQFARQHLRLRVTPTIVIGNRVLKGYNESEIIAALNELQPAAGAPWPSPLRSTSTEL